MTARVEVVLRMIHIGSGLRAGYAASAAQAQPVGNAQCPISNAAVNVQIAHGMAHALGEDRGVESLIAWRHRLELSFHSKLSRHDLFDQSPGVLFGQIQGCSSLQGDSSAARTVELQVNGKPPGPSAAKRS